MRSAASRNVGAFSLRFSASGSPPRRASLRFFSAASRASASVTQPQPPSPMLRRLPLTVRRWTHCFEPPGATRRNSVLPSPYIPGSVMARTSLTVSLPCNTFCTTRSFEPVPSLVTLFVARADVKSSVSRSVSQERESLQVTDIYEVVGLRRPVRGVRGARYAGERDLNSHSVARTGF